MGGDEPVPMGDKPSDIDTFEAEKKNCGCGKDPCVTYGADTDVGTTIDDVIMDEYVDEGEALEDAEDYARKARHALNELGAEEADLTGIIVQDNDPSSPPEGIFATEQEREMEEAARKNEYSYTHSSKDDYRPELDDSSFVEEIDESALYEYEMEQERLRENPVETHEEIVVEMPITPEIEEPVLETTTGPEPGTWASIAFDMAMMSDDDDTFDWNAWKDDMKEKGFDAEMTLREWGESELEEEKHDFSENPNESFREWIDEEVKAHGDISFKDWAKEEESEEFSAETYSSDTMMDSETMDTQIAVAIGIPPEIWLAMSRQKQDAYITSMDLDAERVREMAELNGPQSIMWLANDQKENVTHGDLSLIDCNVCGISASQLLGERGGVCDITDPNAGANPNYIRGVSCPFEKYYSLTRAVYDAVEEDLAENRTVIQLITPRPAAFAAESTTSRVSKFASAMDTFKGQRVSKSETFESNLDEYTVPGYDNMTGRRMIDGPDYRGSPTSSFPPLPHYPENKKKLLANERVRREKEIEANGGWYLLDGDWEDGYEEALIADKDGNTMEIRWYFDISQFRDNKVGDNPKWDGTLEYDFNFDYFNPKGNVEWRDTDGKLLAQAPFTKMEKIPLDMKVEKMAETLMDITKDTSLGDFTSKELTESSAIQGDFDHASLNYSGQQNIQARAEETFKATRGIDTFTEPFESGEEGDKSNLLIAAGIAGLFALGAWLLPKGD